MVRAKHTSISSLQTKDSPGPVIVSSHGFSIAISLVSPSAMQFEPVLKMLDR